MKRLVCFTVRGSNSDYPNLSRLIYLLSAMLAEPCRGSAPLPLSFPSVSNTLCKRHVQSYGPEENLLLFAGMARGAFCRGASSTFLVGRCQLYHLHSHIRPTLSRAVRSCMALACMKLSWGFDWSLCCLLSFYLPCFGIRRQGTTPLDASGCQPAR